MRVFVLSTGRCGTTTFFKACQHIENYTCGHESRANLTNFDRLDYPDNHIEIDNRLTWQLPRLANRMFGVDVEYVWLMRNTDKVVDSYLRRKDTNSIVDWWARAVLMRESVSRDTVEDMVNVMNSNIYNFMDWQKSRHIFELERAADFWPVFWRRIGAKGNYDAALREWEKTYNAS